MWCPAPPLELTELKLTQVVQRIDGMPLKTKLQYTLYDRKILIKITQKYKYSEWTMNEAKRAEIKSSEAKKEKVDSQKQTIDLSQSPS